MQDEELIERIDKMLLASPVDEYTTMIAVEPDDLREIRDRLEALAQPVVGVNLLASAKTALMYLETGFIECEQCGHEVKTKDLDAAYELRDALAASPSPVVGDEGRSPELVEVIREWLMSTDHPVSDWECQFAEAIRSMMRASGWVEPDAILSSTPVMSVSREREALEAALPFLRLEIGRGSEGSTCNICRAGWLNTEPERHADNCPIVKVTAALSTPVTEAAQEREINLLREIEEAARDYAGRFMVDEAEDTDGSVCGEDQHLSAKRLCDAIADIDANLPPTGGV
jgi:hypothetical protein